MKIAEFLQEKFSITHIAKVLYCSKSIIFREIKHNEAFLGQYLSDTAVGFQRKRRQRLCWLDKNPVLKEFVLAKLQCYYWIPKQISGWLKHRQTELPFVSHEAIYRWLYQSTNKKEKLWK